MSQFLLVPGGGSHKPMISSCFDLFDFKGGCEQVDEFSLIKRAGSEESLLGDKGGVKISQQLAH